jgi:hypothetical protein
LSEIEIFLKQYGPLMTLLELAEVLDRSPEGLRISLRNSDPFSKAVNGSRKKLGRRVYFATSKIAIVLGLESPEVSAAADAGKSSDEANRQHNTRRQKAPGDHN